MGESAKFGLLGSLFARSVRDNVIGEAVVQALRLLGLAVLASLVTPEDFGLFRILVVVALVAALAAEAGIPEAFIQRPELRGEHESTAFWMSVGSAALVAGLLYLAAPWAAQALAMPPLRGGIRLLCLPVFVEGVSAIPNARLRRELRFSLLAMAEVVAELAFLAAALVFVRRGLVRSALGAALAARYTVHGLALLALSPAAKAGRPRAAAARELGRFALAGLGGRLLGAASSNAEPLLIGRFLGVRALGLYTMAWGLLRFAHDRLYKVAGRVTLPAFCRLQDSDRELAGTYLHFFDRSARLLLPVAGVLAVGAREALGGLYGPHWAGAAVPLQLLAPGMAVASLKVATGSVYYAKGRPGFDFYLSCARLVMVVCVLALVANGGLYRVSAALGLVEGVVGVGGQYLACRLLKLRLTQLARAALPALGLCLLCTLAALAGRTLAARAPLDAPFSLAAVVIAPAAIFCLLELATLRAWLAEAFTRARPSQLTGTLGG